MAHFKSAAKTTTYFEVKYSTCVCSHVRITLWINAVDFWHIVSIVRFISHCIQHCNWPLCFILLCMCCDIYAVWCVCLNWHNGAYVRSLSRGATCHEGPFFLWTSGGRPWQVLLYNNYIEAVMGQTTEGHNLEHTVTNEVVKKMIISMMHSIRHFWNRWSEETLMVWQCHYEA